MKKIIPIIILVSMISSLGWSQGYRESVRQNVISKLRFHFVANPSQAFPSDVSTLEIDKTAIANNRDITGPLWTDPKNAGLKDLLIKILRRPDQGGEFKLQEKINTVISISNKQVMIFLYADYDNPTFHSSWRTSAVYCLGGTVGAPEHGNYPSGHGKASWPCARHSPHENVVGDIGLGAYFFHSDYTGFTATEKRGVIIHELTHTQLPLSPAGYGPDNNHFYHEMIPSRNSAFDEGLANAFQYRYNVPDWAGMTAWFNNNMKLYVDNWTGCSGDECLQTRLANASVTSHTCPTSGDWAYPSASRCYNIRDIPPEFLLYCENTTGNILYQYMAQFQYGEYFLVRDLNAVKTRMSSASYKFGPLFKQLVTRGMNWRLPNQPAGTVTHGQFLPVGILDYYLGYNVSNKAVLGRAIGSNWTNTDTNIDDYFGGSNKRNVLTGYRNNQTDWHVTRQISEFSRHLNVRPPQQAAATSGSGN